MTDRVYNSPQDPLFKGQEYTASLATDNVNGYGLNNPKQLVLTLRPPIHKPLYCQITATTSGAGLLELKEGGTVLDPGFATVLESNRDRRHELGPMVASHVPLYEDPVMSYEGVLLFRGVSYGKAAKSPDVAAWIFAPDVQYLIKLTPGNGVKYASLAIHWWEFK